MQTPTRNQLADWKKLQQKKYREEAGAFMVEGERQVAEALTSGWEVRAILPTPERVAEFSGPVFATTYPERAHLSSLVTAPEVLAVVAMPKRPKLQPDGKLVLCLDGIADPGNMGSILRSADWFGVKQVLIGPGCVEIFNEKVVRAMMGSLFRLSLVPSTNLERDLKMLQTAGYTVVVTLAEPSEGIVLKEPLCLVIGSETSGVSSALRELADASFHINGQGGAESLNAGVSAGIALYELTKNDVPTLA